MFRSTTRRLSSATWSVPAASKPRRLSWIPRSWSISSSRSAASRALPREVAPIHREDEVGARAENARFAQPRALRVRGEDAVTLFGEELRALAHEREQLIAGVRDTGGRRHEGLGVAHEGFDLFDRARRARLACESVLVARLKIVGAELERRGIHFAHEVLPGG